MKEQPYITRIKEEKKQLLVKIDRANKYFKEHTTDALLHQQIAVMNEYANILRVRIAGAIKINS